MTAILDKPRWAEVFKGHEIVDVAIRQRDVLQLCLRRKLRNDETGMLMDHQIQTRIVSLFLDRPAGENCGYQELDGMGYPVLGVSRAPFPRPGGIVAAKNPDGDAWPHGGGNGPMEKIAPGESPFPNRLKCLDGYTYSVGYPRLIYKRVAVGRWERFGEIPCPDSAVKGAGFNDLDAFSASDMYAVGGHGDVWHWNGAHWQQMGFPTNEQLATVTCAGDGQVYVSSEGGSLWVGRQSTWKPLYKGNSSILWNDVLWFGGRLWLASDYQLRTWDGKALQPVLRDGKPVSVCGHMDAHEGQLVVASLDVVEVFDGKAWRTAVAPYFD